jgi:hypothetical protein
LIATTPHMRSVGSTTIDPSEPPSGLSGRSFVRRLAVG